MWSKPWSYKEGLTIGTGLLIIGILLQMTVVSGMRGQMTAEVICRLAELPSASIRRSQRVPVCFLCKKMGRIWMIQKSIP